MLNRSRPPQRTVAHLRTRCGCTQTIIVSWPPPPDIRLPLENRYTFEPEGSVPSLLSGPSMRVFEPHGRPELNRFGDEVDVLYEETYTK